MNEQTERKSKAYLRRRRIVGLVSLIVVFILSIIMTIFIYKNLLGRIHSPEEFRSYIQSFGWKGRFVLLGLQCLQIVVALIPGEFIEVGAGYAFGAIEGTLLCMAGVAISSSLIFLLTKKLGIRLVEIFISHEKINELRFINSETKLKRTIFILFFIPGSPKDLFTYFAGLTRIKLHEFLAVSMIARIPSVISSTIGGNLFSSENYLSGIILFVVTGLISLVGMALYSQIIKHGQHSDKTPISTEDESQGFNKHIK